MLFVLCNQEFDLSKSALSGVYCMYLLREQKDHDTIFWQSYCPWIVLYLWKMSGGVGIGVWVLLWDIHFQISNYVRNIIFFLSKMFELFTMESLCEMFQDQC